jgi:hypothetical protein
MTGETRSQQINGSLAANNPSGNTPTGPALQGAVDYARAWAEQHPDRAVVVVFATDGLPTECGPTDAEGYPDIEQIAAIAKAAAEGTPAIRTFVVGIFNAAETEAPTNLNLLAEAGHTESAFIVSTDGNVTLKFYIALNEIRASTVSCDFELPTDITLSYDRVNLYFKPESEELRDLEKVDAPESCDSNDRSGWYYLTEPGLPNPTRVKLCPGICEEFRTTNAGRITLGMGCPTRVR